MIQSIEVNSQAKAEIIKNLLGERLISILTIHYTGKQISGYIVHYFTKQGGTA